MARKKKNQPPMAACRCFLLRFVIVCILKRTPFQPLSKIARRTRSKAPCRLTLPPNRAILICMKILNICALTLSAAALLSLTACTQGWSPQVTRINPKTGETETIGGLKEVEAGIIKAFPEIPIPANHRIDVDRSVIFHSQKQSVGKIVTSGSGDIASIYNFYETEMPTKGWTLVNGFLSSVGSLYYARPGTFVAITISQNGTRGTSVTLNIGPE